MRKTVLCLMLVLAAALFVADIGVCEYPEEAPPLDANSDAALTLEDFAYFTDFPFNMDDGYGREWHFPDPEMVKKRFGEPDSEEEVAGIVDMYYPFGWVTLNRDEGVYWGIEVLISTDALEGPRGLRVGDSVEALLAAFHNEDAGLPMQSDEEGEITLYHLDTTSEAIYQYGYAVYLGGEGNARLVTIEYGVDNRKNEQKCTVSFEVGDGVISQIRWNYTMQSLFDALDVI